MATIQDGPGVDPLIRVSGMSEINSAASAFASTFCDRHRTPSLARHRWISNNLPAELLLIIFKLVSDEEGIYLYRWFYSKSVKRAAEILSPSLFPYNIAAVCSLWRDIASLVPKFWRRVVIFLDVTPLSAVASLLSWSRDLTIEVSITRKVFHAAVDARREKEQVMSIMKILGPQIHRLRELHFDVMFSSSLPSFPHDFHGVAHILKYLALKCREDNGDSNDDNEPLNQMAHEPFQCPQLDALIIDGRNCYNICKKNIQWTKDIADVFHLTISHYKPRSGDSFSVYDLLLPLTTLTELETVCIVDIAFTHRIDPLMHSEHRKLCNIYLELKDLYDFQAISEIVDFLDPYSVELTRCSLTGHFIRHPGRLCLREISHDQDLGPLLHAWRGEIFEIIDCPGFGDATLNMMEIKEPSGGFMYVHWLWSLNLTLSTHSTSVFTIGALKRLVKTRFDDVDDRGIRRINCSGNVPHLSPEDRAWFCKHVPYFQYGDR